MPPSPFVFNLSQHQGIFQWVGSSHQVASVSVSILPVTIQGLFPLGLTGLISLLSKGLTRVFYNTTIQKNQFFSTQSSLGSKSHSVHDYWKNHSFDYTDFVSKVMSLLFNMLSRFVIAFLSRSKCLLISWLQSPSTVILEPPPTPNKICQCLHVSLLYLPWTDGTVCHDLSFLNVEF